ncbi:MAG: aspartate aminotransferase family protein [Clostridiales bacterium]|jgi:acetylornithine/N-succinyldiaminopimelate aminotransferase|nr:aspartate aminotransferase family protein [Clostridiales bacterium]
MPEFYRVKELTNKNYMNIFNRQNICFTHGEGNVLFDTNGKSYIDFVSGIGVNCLGYNHPALVAAISGQAQRLIHSSNLYYNDVQAALCDRLLDGTIFTKMFLANSGAEANECAIKLVRKYGKLKKTDRHVVVTAVGSFHGRTLATLTATGQESHYRIYSPLPPGFRHVPYGDAVALKEALTDDVGAVMLEVIQSRSMVTPAENDYLLAAYALCRSKDILFIIDEVQTGMGRTGKLFAFEHYGIQPDIVTLGKGLGAGLPISAVLARGSVAKAFDIGDHGSTLSGNQLACAAASVVVDTLKNGLLDEIADKGAYFEGRLAYFRKYRFIKDIRGRGLLQGIEMTDGLNGQYVANMLAQKGILINCTKKNVIRLLPPYTITPAEIDQFCDRLEDLCATTNI